MKEVKDNTAYQEIPLKVRIAIRLIVILLRLAHPLLAKHKLSAVFAIESYADQVEDRLEAAEKVH